MFNRSGPFETRRKNLERLFAPKSIAVIGASSDPAKAGSQALQSLKNFPGRLVAVHPREKNIQGISCYSSLTEIPEPVDLAILAIPAEHCVTVAEEAAACGVGGIFIISGGFGETGESGARLQERLQEICQRTGLRLLGPNTSGFINPHVNCMASFVPGANQLRKGQIAVVAQSGGVNLAISFLIDRLGQGVSFAAGLGNAVDVAAADVLDWLGDDPNTDAIALHLEGVPKGRELYDTLRRVTAKKPVVALVAGRSDIGEFAVSHTGNLMGSHKRTVSSLTQAGAVVVDSTEALAQGAAILKDGRLPPKEKAGFALVTGQAGPGLLIADGLKSNGLELPPLGPNTLSIVKDLLPPLTFIKNPVDTGRPGPTFAEIVGVVARDEEIDAVLVFGLHEPSVLDPVKVLPPVVKTVGKPIIFGTLGIAGDTDLTRTQLAEKGLPMVESPERLVWAASILAADAKARYRIEREDAKQVGTEKGYARLQGNFDEDRAKALLAEYGIATPQRRLCVNREEAVSAFHEIGGAVVVKIASAEITHKTEAGGVHLNIANLADFNKALDAIERIPTQSPAGFLVEQMAPLGVELIIGGVRDPSWGPCVMVGIGGIFTEALADTAVRLAPLSASDVSEMLDSLQGRKLLDGFRHMPVVNRVAITQVATAVSRLLVEHPEVLEIEINPLRVDDKGALALDALLVVD
ncbi:CoA-binding domain protein [Burkholderia sp. lig30]|jgi:acetyltransferase|uniref:acetate--CoA ligase family protein n=1 Tax=Burkholderia sp. lig30 TaxID=1192124 RepID=UPI000461E059|nr:acetate--CoA ligase family protein [Burkholderia sp. lig30]KDB08141.1 CoA-binding domain protein [Burkholderia sp. lig30]